VWWWGIIVLALAGMTAMGVLYALLRSQAAAHLPHGGDIGIIFIGLGPLAFKAYSMAWAAALAPPGLHVFNHSIFKSLLFFGAGAVLTTTGERDMERLGG
jgi:NADH:ubiquinone oxidoreductase subunit 5 (subunit L)/multisubunit Na+/H+ antiporter MnhA subunit